MKDALISYIKLFLGLSLTAPIIFCTIWADYDLKTAWISTIIIYTGFWLLSIFLFNFLQYDELVLIPSKKAIEKDKNPYKYK